MLKASLAGLAGLSTSRLLRARADEIAQGRPSPDAKSVILLWMAGGPSHLDTWDMKPTRPIQNRGPFSPIATAIPGTFICERMPKIAAIADRITILRSVDARFSNHEPNTVFQTANLDAEPRINREAEQYPAIASIIAQRRGPNHPAMPPYVAFMKSRSHLAFGGYLGKRYDPFLAEQASRLPVYDSVGVDTGGFTGAESFGLPPGVNPERVGSRRELVAAFDRMRSDLDLRGSMETLDAYRRQAVEMVIGRKAQEAFDISREPANARERYGSHLWHQQALLARRLVESGVSFVTIDLSHHTASGTWDTHGDNIPPYGGIKNGLGPLLPIFDHLFATLISDLEERGLLSQTLILAMGEFGRTPNMGTQGSSDGRDHWPVVMSMAMAGGGLRHGQVIGSTERDGGQIKERPVTPADLAATIYRHMGVPLEDAYLDDRGRPRPIVDYGGKPIAELF